MTADPGTAVGRPHVWLPGATATPLLLLHGTGGDEHDLLPLRDVMAPGSAALAPRGTVVENGMPRYFRRLREGVFDEVDLHHRVGEMAEFLIAAEGVFAVPGGAWIALGFSNGANMASAILFDRPELLGGAALFAAMVPFRAGAPDADLTGKKVAVVNGLRDALATPAQTRELVGQLRGRGAVVREFPHAGGHTLDPRSLPAVGSFLGLST